MAFSGQRYLLYHLHSLAPGDKGTPRDTRNSCRVHSAAGCVTPTVSRSQDRVGDLACTDAPLPCSTQLTAPPPSPCPWFLCALSHPFTCSVCVIYSRVCKGRVCCLHVEGVLCVYGCGWVLWSVYRGFAYLVGNTVSRGSGQSRAVVKQGVSVVGSATTTTTPGVLGRFLAPQCWTK